MIMYRIICLTLLLMVATPGLALAEEEPADVSADANNPLASFTTLNFHNYYVPELTGSSDVSSNTFWLRAVKGLGGWLLRGSLPISNVPTSPTMLQSGIGDLNALAVYLIDLGKPGVNFGIGPQVTFDTATEDATGAGKTQLGICCYLF